MSEIGYPLDGEWLEADGLGGFASGTVGGERTRRYHALVLTATTPPTGRVVLVNGFDAWLETDGGRFGLTTQRYGPGEVYPDGHRRIVGFEPEPWPTWRFRCEDGTEVEQEIFVVRGACETALRWRRASGDGRARLVLRPFLSGRDYHAIHHENPVLSFEAHTAEGTVLWRPYDALPAVAAFTNAAYHHDPVWYHHFLYAREQERGLECVEDLASPGTFTCDLGEAEAVLVLRPTALGLASFAADSDAVSYVRALADHEAQRRREAGTALDRAAQAYLVRRGSGFSIVAGYPWFTDWGRDAFIALRGLCLARGELATARDVLVAWAGAVSEGMLPNRFPDAGEEPEYNAVDASLWYVVAAGEFLDAARPTGLEGLDEAEAALERAAKALLAGYRRGTRYGIGMDSDALLACGDGGSNLTWMDVRAGDRALTPRVGKPVEVQALWCNALAAAARFDPRCEETRRRVVQSFRARFWNDADACLYDVVDADGDRDAVDTTFRPNQILAVGGLPLALLEGQRARAVVDAVEARLLTPLGLRSLAPGEAGYRARYEGNAAGRDSAYHQGTVWPWLLGPFVEAWLRVRGFSPEAKAEARERFLAPLLAHLGAAGLGHVSEIADAEPPHTPRGCPFQAWSLGELLRIRAMLADDAGA
ncbi:MAG: amylo-alpha-1,6-glucosidase [Planctomycetota bacterium]